MSTCPTCEGRGEVAAGITGGFVKTGTDSKGHALGHPTWIKPNPAAMAKSQTGDPQTEKMGISIVEENPLQPLWGIAVCGTCRGPGFIR